MKSLIVCSMPLLLVVASARVVAQPSTAPATQPPATQPAAASNKKCPVSGEDINAKSKTVQYGGKTVGFCCDDCVGLFNKNPEKYADKVK